MDLFGKIIQHVSVLFILIPLGIGLIGFRTAGINIRLFIAFLFVGFITDVTMYGILNWGDADYLRIIFSIYSFIEAMSFYYLIFVNCGQRITRGILIVFMIITPVFWTVVIFFQPVLADSQLTPGQLFDTVYEIVVSFLAGFVLLQMIEKDSAAIRSDFFWILIGMFFYCFCTFFIMGFLNTIFSQKIWFLNNVFNIITYVFYSIGLWKSVRK